MNLETFEARLHAVIKRFSMNSQQRYQQQQSNASASMGTMIPTPGVPQRGNSSSMGPSSTDNSLVAANGGNNSMMSSAVGAGNYSMNTPGLSRGMHNGSFGSTEGILYITFT